MRFVDEFRDADEGPRAGRRRSPRCASRAASTSSWRCAAGTPTRSTSTASRTTCRETSTLVHGPGCPVCVIPMGRVDDAIAHRRAARRHHDLVRRHDAGARRRAARSSTPRRAGADIRMVYSPLDALKIARQNPDKRVVFMAIGFETTAPSTAHDRAAGRAPRASTTSRSSATTSRSSRPSRRSSTRPTCGSTASSAPATCPRSSAAGPTSSSRASYGKPLVVRGLRAAGHPAVGLHAPAAARRGPLRGGEPVRPGGAVGRQPEGPARSSTRSMELRPVLRVARPRVHLPLGAAAARRVRRASTPSGIFDVPGVRVADPKACQCGEVLKGVLKPWECKVFGTACTPETPIGTCMVSPEGACAAYYNFGRFTRERVRSAGVREQTPTVGELGRGRRREHATRASAEPRTAGARPHRAARRRTARVTRRAHHAGARRRRQGHPHAHRGGVPRGVPQPAARAAGGPGAC